MISVPMLQNTVIMRTRKQVSISNKALGYKSSNFIHKQNDANA